MNSLYGTPLSGMHGADFALNVTANNIANVNTDGFESVEPMLDDLPAQAAVGDPNNGLPVSPSTRVGMGVRPYETRRSDADAPLIATGNPLDVAVTGQNFIAVRRPDGQQAYTREASLHVQPDGQVLTEQGFALAPPVRVPAGVANVSVDQSGRLTGQTTTGATKDLGKLAVVSFAAPENLSEQSGTYTETLGSGRPSTARVPQDAQVAPGYKLGSTVDLATEMVNLIDGQRMYESNAKALQTMDALVNTVVSIQPR